MRELTPDDAENFYLLNLHSNVIKQTGNPAFISMKAAKEFLENEELYKLNGFGR